MPKIQLRHDTSTNWTTYNPILLEGECGVETDTNKFKFGDGVKTWSQLDYASGGTDFTLRPPLEFVNANKYVAHNMELISDNTGMRSDVVTVSGGLETGFCHYYGAKEELFLSNYSAMSYEVPSDYSSMDKAYPSGYFLAPFNIGETFYAKHMVEYSYNFNKGACLGYMNEDLFIPVIVIDMVSSDAPVVYTSENLYISSSSGNFWIKNDNYVELTATSTISADSTYQYFSIYEDALDSTVLNIDICCSDGYTRKYSVQKSSTGGTALQKIDTIMLVPYDIWSGGSVGLYSTGLAYYDTDIRVVEYTASKDAQTLDGLTNSLQFAYSLLDKPAINLAYGTGLGVSNGALVNTNPTPYDLPTASQSTLGGVKVDGTSITIDGNGVISSSGGGSGESYNYIAGDGITITDVSTSTLENDMTYSSQNVNASSYESGFEPYYAFDGNSSTYWGPNGAPSSGSPCWIERTHDPIKVTQVTITFRESSEIFVSGSIFGSNDGTNYTEIGSWNNNSELALSVECEPSTTYTYTRIESEQANGGWGKIGEITITYQNYPIPTKEVSADVDQTYDATSSNAQSGIAVAEALSSFTITNINGGNA